MRLATFLDSCGEIHFGMAIANNLFSFRQLKQISNFEIKNLDSVGAYLENVEEGFAQVQIINSLLNEIDDLSSLSAGHVKEMKLMPALSRPAALIDFGLSPRHLMNSGRTLIRHEFKWPLSKIIEVIALRRFKRKTIEFPYYKGNHHEISGENDTIPWPPYTSYLDIEPELAFVIGNNNAGKPVIAGYCILNDISARDVQFPEMMSIGPGRCKDFTASNGLSAFLVTPDEINDISNLSVTVTIGDRIHWTGSTAEYMSLPTDIVEYLGKVFVLRPGTVIGMGTIPDCCCLDNDQWLRPGESITIEFDALGKLKQKIGVPTKLEPSRWAPRKDV